MAGDDKDPELEAAQRAISEDVSEEPDEQEPTTDQAGPMTPTAETVQEANVEGLRPDR